MITLDDESTASNCKVIENEMRASVDADVDSALQVVFKFSKHFAITILVYNFNVC